MENSLDDFFKNNQGGFDHQPLPDGHDSRFMAKLNQFDSKKKSKRFLLISFRDLAIAASVVVTLFASLSAWYYFSYQYLNEALAQAQQTKYYYHTLIEAEIQKVSAFKSDENKKILDDAFAQLKKLEKDYEKLEFEIQKNENAKKVQHAMIINFETRLSLLARILEELNNNKQITKKNEKLLI